MVHNWRFYSGDPSSPMSRLSSKILTEADRGRRVKILTTDLEAVQKLRDFNVEVRVPHDVRTLHTKAIAFDDDVLLFGSHNWTNSALQSNLEMSCLTRDFEVVQQYINYYDTMWNYYARGYTPRN